jgi:hypothetical protein
MILSYYEKIKIAIIIHLFINLANSSKLIFASPSMSASFIMFYISLSSIYSPKYFSIIFNYSKDMYLSLSLSKILNASYTSFYEFVMVIFLYHLWKYFAIMERNYTKSIMLLPSTSISLIKLFSSYTLGFYPNYWMICASSYCYKFSYIFSYLLSRLIFFVIVENLQKLFLLSFCELIRHPKTKLKSKYYKEKHYKTKAKQKLL